MGAQKKKAKFIAKGHLAHKLKARNAKKKFQALKDKKKKRFERNSDAPTKKNARGADGQHGAGSGKDEQDMLDDMDVDDFLNADFLDSDAESDAEPVNDAFAGSFERQRNGDDDDDGSSSEEEDESALDPRYLTGSLGDDDEEEDEPADATTDNTGDASDEEGGDEDMDEADLPPAEDAGEQSAGRVTLTMALLTKAEKDSFETHSAGGLRRMMKIFSDACRSSDAADVSKADDIAYDIQSSAVYNRLMVNVFRKTHVSLSVLLGATSEGETVKVDEKKWKKHALMVRRFFGCVCYLLEQTTGQDIQQFVLRELAHYVPFVVPCPKTARRLLKALLKLWAKALNPNVCMLAFVRIRDLALQMPFPFLETCLKGIFVTYMRNTKFTNEATLPHHVLLGNCVVELYGLNMASSYQHAFIYIRQLAIAIRKTIVSPSPDSFKAVLNWQFVNQLRVWTAVVCAYPEENQLKALVYPLCQLLFALARVANTLKYAPMRFHCVKLLQQIAFATNEFVPTSPVLLELLTLQPFSSSYKGHKAAGGRGKKAAGGGARTELNLDLCVKLSASSLEDKRVHDQVISRLFELLQRECDVYKFHIGFPEFAVPLLLTLTKFAEAATVPKWRSLARGLIDSLKKRAEWVRNKRSGLDISPKDVAKIDAFLKSERDNAVQKLMEKDAAELQELLATSSKAQGEAGEDGDAKQYDSDASDAEDAEEAPKKKNKKSKKKKGKKQGSGLQVDEETVAKVKGMSLQEFKKSVAAVDEEDEVGDFAFSDDE